MAAWAVIAVPLLIMFFALGMERVETKLRQVAFGEGDVEEFLDHARPNELRELFRHGIGRAMEVFRLRRRTRRLPGSPPTRQPRRRIGTVPVPHPIGQQPITAPPLGQAVPLGQTVPVGQALPLGQQAAGPQTFGHAAAHAPLGQQTGAYQPTGQQALGQHGGGYYAPGQRPGQAQPVPYPGPAQPVPYPPGLSDAPTERIFRAS